MNDNNKFDVTTLNESLETIHEHLTKRYNITIIEVEMELYKARQTRSDGKIQRYFNATPLRHGFCRWMAYAHYANRYYTISQLVDEMNSNRQSISEIIKDCEAEGWIEVVRKGNTVKCRASALLMDSFGSYCQWRKGIAKSVIGDAYKALIAFEKLVSTDFTYK